MSDGGGESTSSPLDQKIMASSGLLHRISQITLSEENYHRRGKRVMESKKIQPYLVFSALNQCNVFFFTLPDRWLLEVCHFCALALVLHEQEKWEKVQRIRLTREHWNQASTSHLTFSKLELTQDHVRQACMLTWFCPALIWFCQALTWFCQASP